MERGRSFSLSVTNTVVTPLRVGRRLSQIFIYQNPLQGTESTTGTNHQANDLRIYEYYLTPWEEEETPTKVDVDMEATRKDEAEVKEEATLKKAVPTPTPTMLPRRKF